MLLPQILSFFKFYPYCGSSKTEVLCTYFRQRKVPYQKKNRPFSSDVFCQKVRTVSTVATGFIRYWICILKFFLHNVKNLKLLLAFSYTFMHKEITFYIYRSICRLDVYMSHCCRNSENSNRGNSNIADSNIWDSNGSKKLSIFQVFLDHFQWQFLFWERLFW